MEIKCPYCIRDFSVCESWEKTDFLVLRNNTIQFKKEHKYYYQVMDLKCVCHSLVLLSCLNSEGATH